MTFYEVLTDGRWKFLREGISGLLLRWVTVRSFYIVNDLLSFRHRAKKKETDSRKKNARSGYLMINTSKDGTTVNVCFDGIFDRETEDELEHLAAWGLGGVEKLYLDMEGVEDISSTGLRILSYAQKIMNEQGIMYIENTGAKVEMLCRQHDIICSGRE